MHLEEVVVNSPSILYHVMLKIWIGYPAIHNSYSLSNLCIFTWSKLIATRITFQFRIDYHLMAHIPFIFKMRTSPTLFKTTDMTERWMDYPCNDCMESFIWMSDKLVTMRQLLYGNLQELLKLQEVLTSPNRLFLWSTIMIICLSNLSILSVPLEGYSRNALCAINLISTFLFRYNNLITYKMHSYLPIGDALDSFVAWNMWTVTSIQHFKFKYYCSAIKTTYENPLVLQSHSFNHYSKSKLKLVRNIQGNLYLVW